MTACDGFPRGFVADGLLVDEPAQFILALLSIRSLVLQPFELFDYLLLHLQLPSLAAVVLARLSAAKRHRRDVL